MSTPILATKLYVPRPNPKLVLRTRLLDRLNQGLYQIHGFGRKLTLISAPAGFGKTTLVSAWVNELLEAEDSRVDKAVAWLSLDEGDNDPSRFLAYLVAALQAVLSSENGSQIGEGMRSLQQSPQPPSLDSVLTALLNEFATRSDNVILVLDDYHVLDAQPIDNACTFLIEHLPPHMHLVITTREDPQLPLARYRARDQMTELRAADLRFTPDEAASFLNQSMSLNLSAEEIASLETRTEGWISGLQMAAISMQGRVEAGPNGVGNFIQAFAGSHRFVLDYLTEEVLQQQPDHVRNFLLQTAILSRLCGPLCNAVTGREDGKRMLETLESGNLFVVPLDDQRQWYRYHHLFADALQSRLMEEQPDVLLSLHQQASAWFAQNDLPFEAIDHALAAEDYSRAADLIELARPMIEKGLRDQTTLRWVRALPDALVHARPTINIGYAWALLESGELEAAKERFEDVERWLASMDAPDVLESNMATVNDTPFPSLHASLITAWVYYAQASGDIPSAVNYAEQALKRLAEDDHLRRSQVTGLLVLAYWSNGDLETAQRVLLDAAALAQKAGNILDTINGVFVVADLKVNLGHLGDAAKVYEHALQLVAEHGDATPLGLENVYSGLGDLHRERNDLAGAAQHLETSKTLGERIGERVWRYRWCLAQARLRETLGDLDGALKLLNEADDIYIRNPLPDIRPIAALRTRVWIKQNRLTAALGWVHERDLSVDDDLRYLREFEHITLARVLIAQHRNDPENNSTHRVSALLTRLQQAAEAGRRTGVLIEILVVQALAHEAQGDIPSALAALERALTLAEPEGYVRTFVDEGPPMVELLKALSEASVLPAYTKRLLNAVKHEQDESSNSSPHPTTQPLIEPLSARELDVLRLLRTELSGPEIADQLVVALSTVRTHTKSIYGKLNVNNRRSAVKRAEELDLF